MVGADIAADAAKLPGFLLHDAVYAAGMFAALGSSCALTSAAALT